MKSTIICVDDDKWVLDVLTNLLNEFLVQNYTVEKASSGREALEIVDDCLAEGVGISLVISDYIMPGMKGDELLEQIKNKTPVTRRIMLTGFAAIEGITNAINKAGIYRFMSKPWDNKDMMLTVLQAIRSYEQDKQNERLANSHKDLYHKFHNMAIGLQSSLRVAIEAIATAADMRENCIPGHSMRVAEYAVKVAKELNMSEEKTRNLELSALLHDAGKLALGDGDILEIQGIRCFSQNEIARRQAELAKLILDKMDEKILPCVVYHMERVDGQGPFNKNTAAIPLEAKIIGVCNYFDILQSSHPDEAAPEILKKMEAESGRIFDPLLLDALSKIV